MLWYGMVWYDGMVWLVAVLRLREELHTAEARLEEANKESEESRARFLVKAREEAEAREEGTGLRSRVEELEGDWIDIVCVPSTYIDNIPHIFFRLLNVSGLYVQRVK